MEDLLAIFKANQNLPGAPKWTNQQFQDECSNQQTLVVRDPAGMAVAFILYRDLPEALEISYLATSPKAKHQGFMTELLARLLGQAERISKPVWLEVHEKNVVAIALYEKVGFKLAGKRPKYYADGASALLYNYG